MGYLPGDRAPSRSIAETWFGDAARPGVRGVGIAPVLIAGGIKTATGLIHPSSTPASNATTDRLAAGVRAGDANALAALIRQGGMTSNGGWHGAPGKGADYYARETLNNLIALGFVVGPMLDPASWRTLPSGEPANNPAQWQLAAGGAANPFGDVSQSVGPWTPGQPPPTGGGPFPNFVPTRPPTRPGTPPAGPSLLGLGGGSTLTTLVLVGFGAFVLSKVVK